MPFRYFFLLSRRLTFYLLYLMSLDESDLLDDESDKLGSDSRYSGTYSFRAFYLRFDDYIGSVSVLVSGIFAPTGVQSKGSILLMTCSYQQELIPKVVNSSKKLVLKFLIFFSDLKISFIVIVVVRLFLAHSNSCSVTKNIIMSAPMGTILRPSGLGSRVTEANAFIQLIHG